MAVISGFNIVRRFTSQGSFPISCHNLSQRISTEILNMA